MPRLPQFESPIDGLRPNDTGAEAMARAAQSLQMAGDTQARLARYQGAMGERAGSFIAGAIRDTTRSVQDLWQQADAHEALHEIGVNGPAYSKMFSDLTSQWNQTVNKAPINDQAIGQKFNEDTFEPAAQQYMGMFTTDAGQKHAENQINELRQHFAVKQIADMKTRAGDAAVYNYDTTVNNFSAAARQDPTVVDHAIGALRAQGEALIDQLGLSPDEAAKLRTDKFLKGEKQIAVATIEGMADKNPQAALSAIGSGKFAPYLNDQETHSVQTYIGDQIKAADRDAREQRIMARQEAQDRSDDMTGRVLGSATVMPDGKIVFPQGMAQSILKAASQGQLKFTAARELLAMGERQPRDESTPGLLNSLLSRISLPEGDANRLASPEEVLKYVNSESGPNITKSDYDFLAKTMASPSRVASNPLVRSEMDMAGTMITGTLDPTNMAVRGKIDQFKADTITTIRGVAEAGGDIRPYVTPGSPEYLFTPDRIKQYVPSKDEIAKQTIKLAQPTAAKPAPGQTAPGAPPASGRPPIEQFLGHIKQVQQ